MFEGKGEETKRELTMRLKRLKETIELDRCDREK